MNNRHQKALQHPLTTKILALASYIMDKSSQSRKIAQVTHILYLNERVDKLFYAAIQYLDGIDTSKTMLKYLYDIQTGACLVSVIESDECRKRLNQTTRTASGKRKKRKHYGFDAYAVSFIDTKCDELISMICSYGQHSSGSTKESDDSTVE